MPQVYDHYATLPDGVRVGYSLVKRGQKRRGRPEPESDRKDKHFFVRFKVPAGHQVSRTGGKPPRQAGELVELTTGVDALGDARAVAESIVKAALTPPTAAPESPSWDQADAQLAAVADLRPQTLRAYRTAVTEFRKLYPALAGPRDVTADIARQFPHKLLSTPFVKGKAADAPGHDRSPTTAQSRLRHLKSLWRKHWVPAGLATANPWATVPRVNGTQAKRVRAVSDEDVAELMTWLRDRYPDWPSLHLYVQVKALAGCRTADITRAKTADLTPTALVLAGATTKTHQTRVVPLPPDVMAALRAAAGPVWVWEALADGCRRFRPAKSHDPHEAGFNPRSWEHSLGNLFREFNEATGWPKERWVRPHDLRARAMTVLVKLYGVDKAAFIIGCDRQTAQHYADRAQAFGGTDPSQMWGALNVPQK